MDWLNRGMEVNVPAVTSRAGMVNKFSDGMLAVFGVPCPVIPQPKRRPPSKRPSRSKTAWNDW